MNRSLRSQLMAGVAAITLVAFTVAMLAIFFVLRSSLVKEFDSLLATKASTLATLVTQDRDELLLEFSDHSLPEFARKIDPEYFQLWDEDIAVIARSARLGQGDLQFQTGSLVVPGFQSVSLPDGRRGRQIAIQFHPGMQGETLARSGAEGNGPFQDDEEDEFAQAKRRRLTLVVAGETVGIDRAISRLSWLLIAISVGVISGMLSAVAILVSRFLRPLNTLAAQIASRDEAALSVPLSVPALPAELRPVVKRLNELLIRLDLAWQRERVFSANVAHELRTPLTGLRSTIDVTLHRERVPSDYRQSLRTCQKICVDTERLVESLMDLARIECRAKPPRLEPIEIQMLVANCWAPLAAHATDRHVKVLFSGQSSLQVNSDEQQLGIVIANLLSNAVEYVDEGGTIEVSWTTSPEQVELTVSNSGCQLEQDDLMRVFDRFWRADASRSATGIHAGLGLAISEQIVRVLGGALNVHRDGDQFVATMTIRNQTDCCGGSAAANEIGNLQSVECVT